MSIIILFGQSFYLTGKTCNGLTEVINCKTKQKAFIKL